MTRAELLRAVAHIVETVDKYAEDSTEAAVDEVERLRRTLKETKLSCEGEREFRVRAEQQRDVVQKQMGDLNESLCKRIHELEEQLARSSISSPSVTVPTSSSDLLSDVDDNGNLIQTAEERLEGSRRIAAERIDELVHQIDTHDRELAEALDGVFKDDGAMMAVKKLVAFYRAQIREFRSKPSSMEAP